MTENIIPANSQHPPHVWRSAEGSISCRTWMHPSVWSDRRVRRNRVKGSTYSRVFTAVTFPSITSSKSAHRDSIVHLLVCICSSDAAGWCNCHTCSSIMLTAVRWRAFLFASLLVQQPLGAHEVKVEGRLRPCVAGFQLPRWYHTCCICPHFLLWNPAFQTTCRAAHFRVHLASTGIIVACLWCMQWCFSTRFIVIVSYFLFSLICLIISFISVLTEKMMKILINLRSRWKTACVIRDANMASLVVWASDWLPRYSLINPHVFVLPALDGCRINRSPESKPTCFSAAGFLCSSVLWLVLPGPDLWDHAQQIYLSWKPTVLV